MPLPWSPAPLPGEWLGFWLLRLGVAYGLRFDQLLEVVGIERTRRTYRTWARPPDFAPAQIRLIAAATAVPVQRVYAMQRRISPEGHTGQLGLCPECLREDDRRSLPHYWRRDWLDPYVTCCQRHEIDLQPVEMRAIRARRTHASITHWLATAFVQNDRASWRERPSPARLRLQGALRREAAWGCRRSAGGLRLLADTIVYAVCAHAAELQEGVAPAARREGASDLASAPPFSGSLAFRRSFAQRRALLEFVARVLGESGSRERACLWEVMNPRERAHLAGRLRARLPSQFRIDWSQAIGFKEDIVQRSKSWGGPFSAS